MGSGAVGRHGHVLMWAWCIVTHIPACAPCRLTAVLNCSYGPRAALIIALTATAVVELQDDLAKAKTLPKREPAVRRRKHNIMRAQPIQVKVDQAAAEVQLTA